MKNIPTFFAGHRAVSAGIVAGALAIAAVVTILVWPSSPTAPPIVYANVSRNYKACLITTTQDAAQAAPVWKAIQSAAIHAPINAQQIIPPTGTTDQLIPYFNSLIALHCQLIVTTGTDLTDALTTIATQNPRVRFLKIGAAISQPNIHTIPTPLTNPDSITAYVVSATRGKY
jgi:basic membrane lipoprotein Med (substrate-binding protein (PBP1-ABC) superfamily)